MRFAEGDDAMLAEHARWALAHRERVERARSLECVDRDRAAARGPVRDPAGGADCELPARLRADRLDPHRGPGRRRSRALRGGAVRRRAGDSSSAATGVRLRRSSRPSRCSSHSSPARRRASSSSSRSSSARRGSGCPAASPWRSRRSRSPPGSRCGARTSSTSALPFRLRHLPGRGRAADGAARRLALRTASPSRTRPPSSAPTRRSACATSSAAAPTCSTPRTAAPALCRRRSTSTRHSARSSASCAGSCRSTGWRSFSPRATCRT